MGIKNKFSVDTIKKTFIALFTFVSFFACFAILFKGWLELLVGIYGIFAMTAVVEKYLTNKDN